MMDIAIDIAIILCVTVALVLAILRIWEQNRLKKATSKLVRSHFEFDRVLDKVSEYLGIGDEESSSSRASYRLFYRPADFSSLLYRSDLSRLWHGTDASRGRVHYFTCAIHQQPPTIAPSTDDLWMRAAIDRTIAEKFLKESNPEATWIFQDESEYEPALR